MVERTRKVLPAATDGQEIEAVLDGQPAKGKREIDLSKTLDSGRFRGIAALPGKIMTRLPAPRPKKGQT